MDTQNTSAFGKQEMDNLEEILKYAAKSLNRNLSSLEQSLITSLYDDYTASVDRIIVNKNDGLLLPETDDRAGVVDLTEDYACVFKTEPVCVSSPDENIATTNGKMYQDLFEHGAQPMASLLSLSVSKTDMSSPEKTRNLIAQIASPNNLYGIPMVGGDICFSDAGKGVSADVMSIGIIDKSAWLSPASNGEGNHVYLLSTYDKNEPEIFSFRTTYELICDLHDEGLIVSARGVGKQGVLGACADMVAAGNNGIEFYADPFTEQAPDFQQLLKYDPDQIVLIIKEEHRGDMEQLCRKWNKQWLHIGTVTDEHQLTVLHHQTKIAELPANILTAFKNTDQKEGNADLSPEKRNDPDFPEVPLPENDQEIAKFMLSNPNLLSKQWIFEQFDSTIGTNNLTTNFISDTSVLQVKGSRHALAVSFCNHLFNIEKYPEAIHNIAAEASRRVVCSGGAPLALTGCMNFDKINDIQKPEYLHAIRKNFAVACEKLGMSSSGINIKNACPSNDAPVQASIGCIGFLNDKHHHITMSFKGKGDMIYLIGRSTESLLSSEYIRSYHQMKDTPPPSIDLEAEAKVQSVIQRLISRKLVKSAHAISRGGLFLSLLESSMIRGFGFDITVDGEIRKDAFLFGESPSRVVVSVATSRETDFIDFMMETGVSFMTLGHVTREEIRIDDNSYGFVSDYKKKFHSA
ncbi:MAG: hypothetical protein LBQ60_00245 [Bacteroidales bacterium]|jgi:phosphoribosylformylglycinamidine synthase|nr:hypothetical protein [Bacteroidales bacterium]